MSEIYRFQFIDKIPSKDIEETLFWSVFNTESVFGKPKVRLDASFYFDREKKVCVIDNATDVGKHIAQLFTSMASLEFGERAFTVERLEKRPPAGE
ncbi:MAG: hypothetical protein HY548_10330 [Elusimicrobia bacterium]|nr:hypothetical protein [Elusimicrobiota bacterium]